MRTCSAAVVCMLMCVVVIAKRKSVARRTVLAPRLLYLEHCKDERKHYVIVHNFSSIVDARGVLYVNAHMEHLKNAKSLSMMRLVIHKCREVVSANTCEYFATWPFTTLVCTMMAARNMMWSSFTEAIHPEMKCPLQSGTFDVVNATVDATMAEKIINVNMAGNVWTVEVTFTDENKNLFACLNVAVLLNRVNIKQRG